MRILAIVSLLVLTLSGGAHAAGSGDTARKHPEKIAWSWQGPFGTFDRQQLQRGYQVYKEVCAACHGVDGKGNEALGGPRLAGQDDWYLVRQLKNYRQGLRGYDPKDTYGAQMKPMAATLTSDQAVNDVVAYINSLR